MILSDATEIHAHQAEGSWGTATLDTLFFKTIRERPDAVALIDYLRTDDSAHLTPRRITYARAGRIVECLAQRLMRIGIRPDDVVAFQLPHGIESYLTILAILRIQAIACPISILWREKEITTALSQVQAQAIITTSRFHDHDHADMMRYVAANLISVRHIFAFGDRIPDGVESLDDIFDTQTETLPQAPLEIRQNAANHIATLGWETGWEIEQGSVARPIARSHNQWIAAGMMHLLTVGLAADDTILSPYQPVGLIGIGMVMTPWLLSSCTLVLHQPFDAPDFLDILTETNATYTLLPPALLSAMAQEGQLRRGRKILRRGVACVWPSPTLASTTQTHPIPADSVDIIDIITLGERAAYTVKRATADEPSRLPLGQIKAPLHIPTAPILLETRIQGDATSRDSSTTILKGRLQIRGPMLPSTRLNGAEHEMENEQEKDGFINTYLRAQTIDGDVPLINILPTREDIVHIGTSALNITDLSLILRNHSGLSDATMFTVPDPVLGHRLHAAVVPKHDRSITLEDIRLFLSAHKIAPHKLPDQIIICDSISHDNMETQTLKEEALEDRLDAHLERGVMGSM